MIEIGKHSELGIARETSVGLFLVDEEGEDVLLPNKYCPEDYEIGDTLKVFVYLDHEERKIATNLEPKILMNEFALLQVADVSEIGAFLDWGLEKHLLVPFSEQRQKMALGRWYVVRLCFDEKTERLYASNKLNRFLDNDHLTIKQNEKVDLLVYRETELGYGVIINNIHKGLAYSNEVLEPLDIGSKHVGYIKKIRPENKIDISLKPVGFENYNDANCHTILKILENNNGELGLNDKSSPEEIFALLKISKKAFKKAIGVLYKQRVIEFTTKGIKRV
ncbi:MAG: GntR family transcriptional regulator [Bacteroidia bacterium]